MEISRLNFFTFDLIVMHNLSPGMISNWRVLFPVFHGNVGPILPNIFTASMSNLNSRWLSTFYTTCSACSGWKYSRTNQRTYLSPHAQSVITRAFRTFCRLTRYVIWAYGALTILSPKNAAHTKCTDKKEDSLDHQSAHISRCQQFPKTPIGTRIPLPKE